SPRDWSDVWLNEGHATWYHLNYAAEHGGFREAALAVAKTFTGAMKYFYEHGDDYRRLMGPVAKPRGGSYARLFSSQQYYRAALVLYALRQKAGTATFEKIERAWVSRNAGKSVSTADFIALASNVSHRR